MIDNNLSKSQKKIARRIIEKGLQKEYVAGIKIIDDVISKWKTNALSNRETWLQLYDKLNKHDKHISRRYDGMTGSHYLLIIAEQLVDGHIDTEDLADFNEEVKNRILRLSGFDNG